VDGDSEAEKRRRILCRRLGGAPAGGVHRAPPSPSTSSSFRAPINPPLRTLLPLWLFARGVTACVSVLSPLIHVLPVLHSSMFSPGRLLPRALRPGVAQGEPGSDPSPHPVSSSPSVIEAVARTRSGFMYSSPSCSVNTGTRDGTLTLGDVFIPCEPSRRQ